MSILFEQIVNKDEIFSQDEEEMLKSLISSLEKETNLNSIMYWFKELNQFAAINYVKLIDFVFDKFLKYSIVNEHSIDRLIKSYKLLEPYLNIVQQKEFEKTFWKQILHLLNNNYIDNEAVASYFGILPESFNKNLSNRILFNIQPDAYDLTNNYDLEHMLQAKIPIKHMQILSFLQRNRVSGKIFKLIINQSTPAALSLIQRVVFRIKDDQQFMLDENLQPIDVNYNTVHINENDYVRLVNQFHKCSDLDAWKQYFKDFKIIPIFNYECWK